MNWFPFTPAKTELTPGKLYLFADGPGAMISHPKAAPNRKCWAVEMEEILATRPGGEG